MHLDNMGFSPLNDTDVLLCDFLRKYVLLLMFGF